MSFLLPLLAALATLTMAIELVGVVDEVWLWIFYGTAFSWGVYSLFSAVELGDDEDG